MTKNNFEQKILSKEEILFLHLLDFKYNKDDYIVSNMITQQGIQSVLDCDKGYISRILNKNKKKGYIRCSKKKIENKLRIQNAYFLTQKGEQRALKINNLINGKQIKD